MKFLGTHQSSDFNYVLQPCLFIFKVFGFLPLKLKNKDGAIMQAQWDVTASLVTLVVIIGCIAGFGFGVEELIHHEISSELRKASVISYFTTWAQIFALFALGAVALLTSWRHLRRLRTLCGIIFSVDEAIREVAGDVICYRAMRRRFFVVFGVSTLVPVVLSMVNCIVIQPLPPIFKTWRSPCYWFICFAPILLLTLKELQFSYLMFVLKSKFVLVNEQLRAYIVGTRARTLHKAPSSSEIPLTALLESSQSSCIPVKLADIKHLLEIYSNISDGVELLLQIFACHLLLMTTTSFVVITIQSYNLFAMLVHSLDMHTHQVVITVGWILVQIIVIGFNVGVCSSTAKMMSSTGLILHKIQPATSNIDASLFYQVLQLFSLEVLHRKHCFTAAGFFNMDYKLITSIIAAVTTYLVIIIQFHLSNVTPKALANFTTLAVPTATIN